MIAVQTHDFDVGEQHRLLADKSKNPGAIATFTGLVREFHQSGDESPVQSLTLEHYPGMTEKALADIVNQARERWTLQACHVIHRVGELQAGDQIVFVGVAAAHRGDAFAATEFIMDYLKTRAPFWKKQSTAQGSEWIDSRDSDHEAAARWSRKSPV